MKLADDDKAVVTQVLADYYTAFSTLDALAVRRKADGEELERAGVVHLLQKTDAKWQFAAVVIHDAGEALRPD